MVAPSGFLDVDLLVTRRGGQLEVRVLDSPAGETSTISTPLPHALLAPTTDPLTRAWEPDDGTRGTERAIRPLVTPSTQVSPESRSRADARIGEAMPSSDPASTDVVPLRVLLAVSTPDDAPAINAAAEIARIESRLQPVRWGAAVEVVTLRTASLDTIRSTLQDKDFHVFHYIGHGSHPVGGTGHLDLTGPDGTVSSRRADEVAAVLAAAPTLRLAILNCCHSSATDDNDPFAGTATALVKAGVPAVVAMRRSISDHAAVKFADTFYAALVASGGQVEPAVALGRQALSPPMARRRRSGRRSRSTSGRRWTPGTSASPSRPSTTTSASPCPARTNARLTRAAAAFTSWRSLDWLRPARRSGPHGGRRHLDHTDAGAG